MVRFLLKSGCHSRPGGLPLRRTHVFRTNTAPREGACMVWSDSRICAWLEVAVVLFQVVGVAALCLNRLLPTTRWGVRARAGFVLAMFGLGFAGALCGRHD